MPDKRATYNGKKVCVVCETPIPDSDESGVSTGACSQECHISPGYDEFLEEDS